MTKLQKQFDRGLKILLDWRDDVTFTIYKGSYILRDGKGKVLFEGYILNNEIVLSKNFEKDWHITFGRCSHFLAFGGCSKTYHCTKLSRRECLSRYFEIITYNKDYYPTCRDYIIGEISNFINFSRNEDGYITSINNLNIEEDENGMCKVVMDIPPNSSREDAYDSIMKHYL